MRLIDTDTLDVLTIIGGRMNGKMEFVKAINEIIQNAPTVDAIPVEWIRKYTKENRLYQSDDFDLYIDDMIADWMERKKNGKTDLCR